jgi:predicted DNA-binding protein
LKDKVKGIIYDMIKRTTISLRIDKKTKDKLQALEDKSGMSKSDVVRQGIKMMYEEYLSNDPTNDGDE